MILPLMISKMSAPKPIITWRDDKLLESLNQSSNIEQWQMKLPDSGLKDMLPLRQSKKSIYEYDMIKEKLYVGR